MKISLKYPISFLVLLLSSSVSYSAENLTNDDLVGCWNADPPITQGEVTTLMIDDDYHITLQRNFGTKKHTAKSNEGIHFYEDIMIAQLNIDTDSKYYKFVASGWKAQDTQFFFGMLYMYNNNTLFNGLPFRFKKVGCK